MRFSYLLVPLVGPGPHRVELERAHTPEDMGRNETCAICAEPFRSEVILAFAYGEDYHGDPHSDLDVACPECVALLGRYEPDKFPTREEYEAALKRFDGPIWASTKEASVAWEAGPPHAHAIEASRIVRSSAVGDAAVLDALKRSDALNVAAVLVEDLPDASFGAHDRERMVRSLSEAGDGAAEECERYKEAFGIPAS